jgi:hypothetical protein
VRPCPGAIFKTSQFGLSAKKDCRERPPRNAYIPAAASTHPCPRLDRDNTRTKCWKSGGSLHSTETFFPERGWTN